ncbi:unnamed protein product, partial [Meganyctiphanes norvegica]
MRIILILGLIGMLLSNASASDAAAAPGRSLTLMNNNNPHTEIMAQYRSKAFLPCRTHTSMERQVSWVRRRDWHILTSGTVTYTNDQRFAVHHPEGSTEWTLAIHNVKQKDAGTYECQISTGDNIVSHLVHLKVVVPHAVIPGNGEYHVETGSTISLVCFIKH